MGNIKHNTADLLVDSLSVELPGYEQYVVERRNCTLTRVYIRR